MNKLKLIFGILSLVVAAGLVVVNLVLPPESIRFDIGYGNMPWVPPVVFAITGIVLMVTVRLDKRSEMAVSQPEVVQDPGKAALNQRLESAFLGLFFIMLAGWWLIPAAMAPKGLWSLATGLLLLGLNAARYASKIKMSGFTTILGSLSLLGGIIELAGLANLNGALLLLVLGAYLILKPWFEKQGVIGRAEEG